MRLLLFGLLPGALVRTLQRNLMNQRIVIAPMIIAIFVTILNVRTCGSCMIPTLCTTQHTGWPQLRVHFRYWVFEWFWRPWFHWGTNLD